MYVSKLIETCESEKKNNKNIKIEKHYVPSSVLEINRWMCCVPSLTVIPQRFFAGVIKTRFYSLLIIEISIVSCKHYNILSARIKVNVFIFITSTKSFCVSLYVFNNYEMSGKCTIIIFFVNTYLQSHDT